ncbi:MAG: SIMPL domain-containing protein [Desulfobaccales bacterium]
MRLLPHLFLILLGAALIAPVPAAAAEPAPPTISVSAEGKVMAKPDMATLHLEVETQGVQSQAAAAENARVSESLLQAMKKILKPEEKIQTLSYRLIPLRSYKDKTKTETITGYQAIHRFQVEVRDLEKLGLAFDTALKNGASKVNGPFWDHSRLEELQRQAAVAALAKARRLADALAQAAGVKIMGLQQAATGLQPFYPRNVETFAAAKAAPSTPVEVGEEEIKANVNAVFLIGP